MRFWNTLTSKCFRNKRYDGLTIGRDRDRTLRRRLRRIAAETTAGAIEERGTAGRAGGSRRRRLAGQGMVEALSRSHTRSVDRTRADVLADSGHGACPL